MLISYVNTEVKTYYPNFTSWNVAKELIKAGFYDENIPLDDIYTINLKHTEIKTFESDAFSSLRNVENVIFPETLEEIPAKAFLNWKSLYSALLLDKSLKKIGDFAFCGCNSLEGFIIPSGIEYIGESAFSGIGTLLMEYAEQPSNWHPKWADGVKKIYWTKK